MRGNGDVKKKNRAIKKKFRATISLKRRRSLFFKKSQRCYHFIHDETQFDDSILRNTFLNQFKTARNTCKYKGIKLVKNSFIGRWRCYERSFLHAYRKKGAISIWASGGKRKSANKMKKGLCKTHDSRWPFDEGNVPLCLISPRQCLLRRDEIFKT